MGLAPADHQESLVRRLRRRLPAEFNAASGKGLHFAAMRMEWASADIDEALQTTTPPATYFDFDSLTEDGGNVTVTNTDATAGTAGNAFNANPAELAGSLDASTGGGGADDDDERNVAASSLSTGVLALAILVPIFVVGIIVYIAMEHKKHRKVHVVPTGLSFKQPAAMQSLPSRGIPSYKDRTIEDVRSNALSSMPRTDLPKRLSSAGTRLPPMPSKHDVWCRKIARS